MTIINNTNSIYYSGFGTAFTLAIDDPLDLWSNGYVIALGSSQHAIRSAASLQSDVTRMSIDGYVACYNSGYSAVRVDAGTSAITVQENGRVFASNGSAAAMYFGNQTTLINFGSINCVGGPTVLIAAGANNEVRNQANAQLRNSNTAEAALKFTNSGNNTINNDGEISRIVSVGFGTERILNSGDIYSLDLGFQNDTMTNFASGTVYLAEFGAGEDQFFNYGRTTFLDMGDGADIVINGNDGLLGFGGGEANLGSGDDRYTGNGWSETVIGGLGRDTVVLGDGDDTFIGEAGAGDLTDTINGGTGFDRYYADTALNTQPSSIRTAVTINLDTVAHGAALAQRATGAEIGVDLIIGFEAASGAGGNDVLHGSGIANGLVGNEGNDALYAYAGNDTLVGGSGNDYLRGGRGADQHFGEAGRDGFVFDTAAISAEADSINDFTTVDDSIWLDNAVFPLLGAGGVLNAAFFKAFTSTSQLDSNDLVAYQTTTGRLYVDMNGAAAGGWLQIATLTTKPVITAADFIVF
jgi:Ca2+-binding RTX toxin-like protein